MRRICTYALVALLGLSIPLSMTASAAAQASNPPNNPCLSDANQCLFFGALGAGLLAGILAIVLSQHHNQSIPPQVSP